MSVILRLAAGGAACSADFPFDPRFPFGLRPRFAPPRASAALAALHSLDAGDCGAWHKQAHGSCLDKPAAAAFLLSSQEVQSQLAAWPACSLAGTGTWRRVRSLDLLFVDWEIGAHFESLLSAFARQWQQTVCLMHVKPALAPPKPQIAASFSVK